MTTSLRKASGARAALDRVLESPHLVRIVQELEPRALAALVDRVGLEDAGELVGLATTEQLERVFDEDLWRAEGPGEDEELDHERFGLWLTVLLETGEQRVAERLVEMDRDFLTLALSRELLVLDLDEMTLSAFGRDELEDEERLLDKALESALSQELDKYLLVARDEASWDAVLDALLALDARHHDVLLDLLERCAALGEREAEDAGGLYEVLTESERLASDVAGDREERRAKEGFVAPRDAKAFLALAARQEVGADIISKRYLRSLDGGTVPAAGRRGPSGAGESPGLAQERDALRRVLDEAELLPVERAPRLLTGGHDDDGESPTRAALASLARTDPGRFERRAQELAYLANVLMAGVAVDGRRLRPVEASLAAVALSDRGLEEVAAAGSDPLVERSLVSVFGVGVRRALAGGRALDDVIQALLAGAG